MEKTIKAECGHKIIWTDWDLGGGYPMIGAEVWCPICDVCTFVKDIDPNDYNQKPGRLITTDTWNGPVWHEEIGEFDKPEELIGYLEAASRAGQFAVYGLTIWATDEAIEAATGVYKKHLYEPPL